MKDKVKVIGVIGLALMLAGCMSMDEMLASDDPFWHDIGESQAMRFAIDQYGTADLQAKLDAVGKMRDQEKLAKVYVAKSTVPEVKKAVRSKITEEKAFASMLVASDDPAIHYEAMTNIKSDEVLLATAGALMGDVSKKMLADELIGRVKGETAIAGHLARIVRDELALKKKIETTEYLTTSMRNDDIKKFMSGYESYKTFARYVKANRAIRELAADNAIQATKGTQYDFATPLESAIEAAQREAERIAAEKEREKTELLKRNPAEFAKKYPDDWKKHQEEMAAKKAAAEKAAAEEQKRLLEDCSDGAAYAIYCGKADTGTLMKIAKEHKQKVCRFIAAYKCGGDVLKNFIATEKPDDAGKNLSVGGLYLGMNFADAYVAFVKNFPDMKFKIESTAEELAVVNGGNGEFAEMNIVQIRNEKNGEIWRVARADQDTAGMSIKSIQLTPEMVVELYGDKGGIEETGKFVFQKLGLMAKTEQNWVKFSGTTAATQDVLKYKSMSGGSIYFALENADIDQGTLNILAPDDEVAKLGFTFGVHWQIERSMGKAGTLMLVGSKITGGGAPKNSTDDDIEARHQKMLEKWGPGAASNTNTSVKKVSENASEFFGVKMGMDVSSSEEYKDDNGRYTDGKGNVKFWIHVFDGSDMLARKYTIKPEGEDEEDVEISDWFPPLPFAKKSDDMVIVRGYVSKGAKTISRIETDILCEDWMEVRNSYEKILKFYEEKFGCKAEIVNGHDKIRKMTCKGYTVYVAFDGNIKLVNGDDSRTGISITVCATGK